MTANEVVAGDIPVVYVNDNFGDWRCNFDDLVNRSLNIPEAKPLVRPLMPAPESSYILKPMHSGS